MWVLSSFSYWKSCLSVWALFVLLYLHSCTGERYQAGELGQLASLYLHHPPETVFLLKQTNKEI